MAQPHKKRRKTKDDNAAVKNFIPLPDDDEFADLQMDYGFSEPSSAAPSVPTKSTKKGSLTATAAGKKNTTTRRIVTAGKTIDAKLESDQIAPRRHSNEEHDDTDVVMTDADKPANAFSVLPAIMQGIVTQTSSSVMNPLSTLQGRPAVDFIGCEPSIFPYLASRITPFGNAQQQMCQETWMIDMLSRLSIHVPSKSTTTKDSPSGTSSLAFLLQSPATATATSSSMLPPNPSFESPDTNGNDSRMVAAAKTQTVAYAQKQLQQQFAKFFLYDTAQSITLAGFVATSAGNLTPLPHYTPNLEASRHLFPPSDAQKQQALTLASSHFLQAIRKEDEEKKIGARYRHETESCTIEIHNVCPALTKAYLERWLESSESHRDLPRCMNQGDCRCVRLASREGYVETDKRIPHGVTNGSTPLTIPMSTYQADSEMAMAERDRAIYTNNPTQGFIGIRFLLPDEYNQWTQNKNHVFPPGPCLVCHIDAVHNRYMQILSGNCSYTDDKPLNLFSIYTDRPKEFRSDICLVMVPDNPDAARAIKGYFPRFNVRDFDYEKIAIEGSHSTINALRWVGVDFRQSSVE